MNVVYNRMTANKFETFSHEVYQYQRNSLESNKICNFILYQKINSKMMVRQDCKR